MSDKTNQWVSDINAITQTVKQHFGQLSEQELNHKPDSSTWSIAQNLAHLMTVNESYFHELDQLKQNNYSLPLHGRLSAVRKFFGNLIMKNVGPKRKKKVKTMSIWKPGSSEFPGDIVTKFEAHQNKLKDYIRRSEPLITKKVAISSPANKNIVYDLDKAFDIIVAHEWRHFAQAQELL